MTGSETDFKSRQQFELDRFDELWKAAYLVVEDPQSTVVNRSDEFVKGLLKLAYSIFQVEMIGLRCAQTGDEFILHQGAFKKYQRDPAIGNAYWSEFNNKPEGCILSDFKEKRSANNEILLNISQKANYFACFPLKAYGDVEAHFFLAHSSEIQFKEAEIFQIKSIIDLLENMVSTCPEVLNSEKFALVRMEMARLKAIVESISGEVLILDTTQRGVIVANALVCKKLGYTRQELKSLTFLELCSIGPDELDRHISLLDSHDGQKITFETAFIRKDHSIYPVNVELTLDKNGQKPVLVIFAQDVSEHQNYPTQLEVMSAHHRSALAANMEMGFCVDVVFSPIGEFEDLIVKYADLGRYAFPGFSELDMMGQRVLATFPDVGKTGLVEKILPALDMDELLVFDHHYISPNFEEWFRVSVLKDGEKSLQIGLRGISDKKRRERALMELYELSADLDISTDEYLKKMLLAGRTALGMEYAFVCAIEGDNVRMECSSKDNDCAHELTYFPFEKTILSRIWPLDKAVFLSDIDLVSNLYEGEDISVRAYAAAPIFVQGDVVSFVSFISEQANKTEYDEFQIGIISVIARMISQRKTLDLAREELEKSRDELQLIFDNVPTSIWRKDRNHRYLKVNKSAADLVGMSVKDIVGLRPQDVFVNFDEKACLALDEQVLATGKAMLGVEVEGGLGPDTWESIDIIPVLGEGVENEGWLIISTDITRQKHAEMKLAVVVDELEAANKNLEQFNTVVSHDLKAPLRHMRMLSELLSLSVQPDSEAAEYAALIQENAVHGQAMVDSLNALSRVSRSELKRVPTDLRKTISMIEALLSDELEEVGGRIVVNPLPSIDVDAELVLNLFQNLIENSMKYRSDASPVITIGVDTESKVPVFFVQDNGLGIKPDYSQEIFQIFTRVHESASPPKGDGVGLSICRRIIERHGGKIWLDEDYTGGARFKFTFAAS